MPNAIVELDGGGLSDGEMQSLLTTGLPGDGRKSPEPAETRIMNPVTGALVDLEDIDSLILGCDETKKLIQELQAFERLLRETAWKKTVGTTKTRRLRGQKYVAKVEGGDRYPVQSILKEAWQAYPQYREQYLKIESVKPVAKEVKKLESMQSDDAAFTAFAGMLKDAVEKGTEGLCRVTLESGGEL